ncbi:MAG: hypothetical protein D6712_10650, partial [Chloroflexi bacterium]
YNAIILIYRFQNASTALPIIFSGSDGRFAGYNGGQVASGKWQVAGLQVCKFAGGRWQVCNLQSPIPNLQSPPCRSKSFFGGGNDRKREDNLEWGGESSGK